MSIPMAFELGATVFFFNDTATTEIYTLSLHDALPILPPLWSEERGRVGRVLVLRSRNWSLCVLPGPWERIATNSRSEEHTSELQSRSDLVCRLLLEKKKRQYQLLLAYTPTGSPACSSA